MIFPNLVHLADKGNNEDIINEYLEKTSSFFSGIVGIIFGYYFGHRKVKAKN